MNVVSAEAGTQVAQIKSARRTSFAVGAAPDTLSDDAVQYKGAEIARDACDHGESWSEPAVAAASSTTAADNAAAAAADAIMAGPGHAVTDKDLSTSAASTAVYEFLSASSDGIVKVSSFSVCFYLSARVSVLVNLLIVVVSCVFSSSSAISSRPRRWTAAVNRRRFKPVSGNAVWVLPFLQLLWRARCSVRLLPVSLRYGGRAKMSFLGKCCIG